MYIPFRPSPMNPHKPHMIIACTISSDCGRYGDILNFFFDFIFSSFSYKYSSIMSLYCVSFFVNLNLIMYPSLLNLSSQAGWMFSLNMAKVPLVLLSNSYINALYSYTPLNELVGLMNYKNDSVKSRCL